MTSIFQDIDEASDMRLFWKQVKWQRHRNTWIYPEIEIDGKKTKSKDFNSKFYNSTENAYHCQHRQISIYGDSTFTQGNQMFYIALETSITFFSFMVTWPRDHKILKSYYHLWIFFWKPTFSKPKKIAKHAERSTDVLGYLIVISHFPLPLSA